MRPHRLASPVVHSKMYPPFKGPKPAALPEAEQKQPQWKKIKSEQAQVKV